MLTLGVCSKVVTLKGGSKHSLTVSTCMPTYIHIYGSIQYSKMYVVCAYMYMYMFHNGALGHVRICLHLSVQPHVG